MDELENPESAVETRSKRPRSATRPALSRRDSVRSRTAGARPKSSSRPKSGHERRDS